MAPRKITPAAAAAAAAAAAPSAPVEVAAPAPAPAPAPPSDEKIEAAPAPAVEDAPAAAAADPIQAKLTKLTEYVAARTAAAKEELLSCKELLTMIKALSKEVALVQKRNTGRRQPKKNGDASATSGNRQSGFTKPVDLSDALCDFLGIPHGSKLPRTEVTRGITKYIMDNKLYDEADKRHILADEKLSTLLDIKGAEPPVNLTYFNLQTHMKHHFLKDGAAAGATSASETEGTATA
jgi:upstream activation factor subunit UAF30